MTKENMPSRQIIPMPFAGGSGAALSDIKRSADPDDINFVDGFPSAYSSPKENNGKFVTRAQINAIGNLASRNEFVRMCGGLNTFSKEMSDAIGGYPRGAVLDVLIGSQLFKAVSLIDNNIFDVSANGADGIAWAYLNQDEGDPTQPIFFYSQNIGQIGDTMLGVVQAKKSGGIIVDSTINVESSGERAVDFDYSRTGAYTFSGCSLAIRDLGTSIPGSISFPSVSIQNNNFIPNWGDFKNLAGNYAVILNTNSGVFSKLELASSSGTFTGATQGHYYAVALLMGEGDYGTGDAAYTLSANKFKVSGSIKLLYA